MDGAFVASAGSVGARVGCELPYNGNLMLQANKSSMPMGVDTPIPSSFSHSTSRTIVRWLSRAGFALSDQALLSGTTFVLNLMFARWMSTKEFGVFAVQMSCLIVLSGVQNALVLEPMTIFGAGKYRFAVAGYIAKLGWLQVSVLAIACAAAFVLVEISEWVSSLVALMFAMTLCAMTLFGFIRKTIYLRVLPHFALIIGATYAATCIGSALVMHWLGDFSPTNGIAVFAAGWIVGGVVGWWLLRSHRPKEATSEAPPTMRALCRDHWRYGRWALGTAIAFMGSSAAYPPIIASILSFESAGRYRAIDTLFAPVDQLLRALSTLVLPAIVGRRSREASAVSGRWVRVALLVTGAIAALYVVPMVLFGPTIALYVFAKPEYASDWRIFAFIGSAAVLGAVQGTACLFLRSLERPHGEFWSQLSVAAVSFSIGLGAGMLAGLDGLAGALVIARGSGVIVALWLLNKEMAKPSAMPSNPIGSPAG
jgi:O-antigen/teichoic acid export membrane protein